jgi:hypothetical protein
MSTRNTILISNITTENIDSSLVYSDKMKGAGYHLQGDRIHTVFYDVNAFIGHIKLQGTLSLYPGNDDWIDIGGTELGLNSDSSAWTSVQSINFTGNYTWIRAAYNLQNGSIRQIRYNF